MLEHRIAIPELALRGCHRAFSAAVSQIHNFNLAHNILHLPAEAPCIPPHRAADRSGKPHCPLKTREPRLHGLPRKEHAKHPRLGAYASPFNRKISIRELYNKPIKTLVGNQNIRSPAQQKKRHALLRRRAHGTRHFIRIPRFHEILRRSPYTKIRVARKRLVSL